MITVHAPAQLAIKSPSQAWSSTMTPAAIPLLGLITKHEQGLAAAGIKTTRRARQIGDLGKLKEGAVAVPP